MTPPLDFNKDDYPMLNCLQEGLQVIGFDWRYLYVNTSVVKHARLNSKEDLLGYTMMEKFPGIEKTAMFEKLRECMETRANGQMENEFAYPDGSSAWFEQRIHPATEGIMVLSLDITERKKSELARERLLMELEQMIFLTSHKVRQPVSNLSALSALINRDDFSQEELKRISGYMVHSVNTLDSFTHELTEFITQKHIDIKNSSWV